MSVETEKTILPHGWIVKTSNKYPDRVYYFNLVTGSSSWECPELVPKPKSDGFKEPEAKKSVNKSFECEPEMGRFVSGIHTPEESPISSRPHFSVTISNDRKSLKRPMEEDTISANKSLSQILKPLTAIVNPVTKGPERKASTNNVTPQNVTQSKKLKKSKKKNKNNLVPLPVPPEKKKESPKSGQNTAPTSSNSSSAVVLQTSLPTSIASSAESSMMTEDNEDSFCEDVEMVDVSASLPSVEETVAEIHQSTILRGHYMVVDTNFFIHELDHIDGLKETPLQRCGPPHIFIPSVVFKELDGLKTSPDKHIGYLARRAIRYIHNALKTKHPRIHGQSAKQADECKRSYHDTNDDKLIDLCMTLRKKNDPEKVILLTNDKNLASRAMCNEIICHNWMSLMENIKPDIKIIEDTDLRYKPWRNLNPMKNKRKSPNKKEPRESNYVEQKRSERRIGDQIKAYKEQIDKLMERAQQLLKDVLDPLLVTEMRRVYNEKVLNQNLQGIVAAYINHWSLFCQRFSNDPRNSFEILNKKLNCTEGQYDTLEDCMEVLNAVKVIFEGIRVQDPQLPSLVSEIESLKSNCTQIFSQRQTLDSSLIAVESISREKLQATCFEIFNFNWSVVNDLCGMIMDFFGIQHSFVYPKPETIPAESEYKRVTADLYPYLLQLRQLMKKMLNNVRDSAPSKIVFKKLCTALKNLIPSLNIKYTLPDIRFFTYTALEIFCRDPENRQKIEFGFKQLDQFCNKLKEAIQVMIAPKKPQTSLLCDKSL
ncbi:hypothetical protein JTE90_019359 [Oedothorax gibbosus]|uniref:WW domain-containing protein n=1 Tax=Oedothorax gibbosus TaxID=931172 RepID=A0AAV6UM78_9ARAC|nr:hypothetical protein JTE90_019359 [Oedothorax gibbosus]